jgi:putative ABC transport system permease protein
VLQLKAIRRQHYSTMIKNYIKIAFRNLWRFRGYTLINILGLAIGMACVMLIMMYVKSELSFDTFHANRDRIYRLNINVTNPQTGDVNERAIGPYRLADELEVDFTDLAVVRFAPQYGESVTVGNQDYQEDRLTFVDQNAFEVFTFPFVKGTPHKALIDPFSAVISEDAAQKYFSSENPIGKVMQIRDRDFVVTGIIDNVPDNSQFQFDVLLSMNSAEQVFGRIVLENWGEGYVETYVMTPPGRKADSYTKALADFTGVKLEAWAAYSPKIVMQPLPSIYLHSKDISSFTSGGDIIYVYAFSFIALFILIIACINFMNLATARSSMRAKEVGLRKVVGAQRSQLMGQFLSESTLLALLSLIIGAGIAILVLPYFNQLADKDLTVGTLLSPQMIVGLLLITTFVGFAAGSYPAFVLSGYKPIGTLSGSANQGVKGGALRRVLVSFQFATSIFLLVVTGVVYKQLSYCRNINLGFDKEHVLIFGAPLDMRGKYDQFRTELMSNPQIVNSAGSSRVPPGNLSSSLGTRPQGIPEDQRKGMQTVWTDYDFIETMGFEMASGRSFSRDFPADASGAFIINEAAVRDLGWTNESAINKTFGSSEIRDWESGQWEERDGKVIGVLKDFYFENLKQKIVPTVYFIAPYMAWNYVVRVKSDRLNESIAFIEEKWNEVNSELPFDYAFIDEDFAELYENEERQGRIFGIFAGLAIFIACLGLVGLASFTAERKKKELGVRKVLGASSFGLVVLLSKEFTVLVVIAFILAAPLAWYVMDGWLQDFAYRSPIGGAVFLVSGGMSVFIAWLTVGLQTARTAYKNPVESLRYE